MKQVTILMCLLAISFAGCNSEMSAWAWGDDGAVGARIGTNVTENNEAGLSMSWWPDDSGPRKIGVYGFHHFPNLVEFRNPIMVEFLPETFEGRPYIGGKLDIDLDTNNTLMEPVAGITFEDTIFFEYESERNEILFGLRAKFKF